MNTLSSEKFSFSFVLAILFHLMLLTASVLTLSPASDRPVEPPIEAMQASLFDEQVLENQLQQARFLSQIPEYKLTKAEKRRLAREKRAASRWSAKKKKVTAAVPKNSPLGFPQLNATSPAAGIASSPSEQAKKAQARERWLKKLASQKKKPPASPE